MREDVPVEVLGAGPIGLTLARLAGGVDIFACDPDGPLPELKPSNAARARQEMIIAMGKRGMTIRQIGRVLAMSQAHRVLYGTPKRVCDGDGRLRDGAAGYAYPASPDENRRSA